MAESALPARIRLYTDEHVWRQLAAELRARGYDAINVHEVDRAELSDEENWDYAAQEDRVLLTFDKDGGLFVNLAAEWFYAGRDFAGLVVSSQIDRGELLRRVLKMLDTEPARQLMNTVRFLEDFK